MMHFCVDLFTVDENFETGSKWIFFTDIQFLTISRELGFIFANIIYTWFVMAERERERERERFLYKTFKNDIPLGNSSND